MSCRSSPFGYIHYATLIITIRSEREEFATPLDFPALCFSPKRLSLWHFPRPRLIIRVGEGKCAVFLWHRTEGQQQPNDETLVFSLLFSLRNLVFLGVIHQVTGTRGSSSAFKPVALVEYVWSGRLGRASPRVRSRPADLHAGIERLGRHTAASK